ncbi:restriction endonuclease [Methylobacterium segetis]|uniref:restriction endonuclease n=1 Tax=Methylobacterium segetis TaxID=2488750 RepID=UPI001053AE4A|nr:restriction endonuclease [Methylobacterium segetis]
MIDWTEIADGDTWELFARDFLSEMGFVVDVGPGRGSDGGRDLVVSEQLKGTLYTEKFRWLVSCKHNATSGNAVGSVEFDIADRCRRNKAQGFMGFYSTVPSASLIQRLGELRLEKSISSFEIFDHRRIESIIAASGMTTLLLRYTPSSYGRVRPIQKFFGDYAEIRCDICSKDVLSLSVSEPFSANLVWGITRQKPRAKQEYKYLMVGCKGGCDRALSDQVHAEGLLDAWEDIGDLCNPLIYMKNICSYTNLLRSPRTKVSDQAHQKLLQIYIAISQRTLRDVTKDDEKRFRQIQILDEF